MLKQRFLGLPGLCLCLLLCSVLISCATKRNGKVAAVNEQLELKAWFIPAENGWLMLINDALLAAPYDIRKELDGYPATNRSIVTYRVNDMEQALALKQKLLETGQVEGIVISNYKKHY